MGWFGWEGPYRSSNYNALPWVGRLPQGQAPGDGLGASAAVLLLAPLTPPLVFAPEPLGFAPTPLTKPLGFAPKRLSSHVHSPLSVGSSATVCVSPSPPTPPSPELPFTDFGFILLYYFIINVNPFGAAGPGGAGLWAGRAPRARGGCEAPHVPGA